MVSSSYISLSDLKSLTFNEFYNRRVVISRISLLRNGGILLSQWLTDNEHLVLSSSRSSSKSKWGKQSSHLQKTAFFHAENQFSDNCPDGCLITPCYKILDSLTVEQINQTPTIAELFFGIMKKYPEQIQNTIAHIKYDMDDITYLTCMHPKFLIQNK